jgi:hypothetical protein
MKSKSLALDQLVNPHIGLQLKRKWTITEQRMCHAHGKLNVAERTVPLDIRFPTSGPATCTWSALGTAPPTPSQSA